jgi:hypothetical protein
MRAKTGKAFLGVGLFSMIGSRFAILESLIAACKCENACCSVCLLLLNKISSAFFLTPSLAKVLFSNKLTLPLLAVALPNPLKRSLAQNEVLLSS